MIRKGYRKLRRWGRWVLREGDGREPALCHTGGAGYWIPRSQVQYDHWLPMLAQKRWMRGSDLADLEQALHELTEEKR